MSSSSSLLSLSSSNSATSPGNAAQCASRTPISTTSAAANSMTGFRATVRWGRRILVGSAAVLVAASYVRALGWPGGGSDSGTGTTAGLHLRRDTDHGKSRARGLRTSDNDHVQWTTIKDSPSIGDFYSASWIMSVPRFLEADYTDRIRTLEDGVFAAFGGREQSLRMSLDYLDWAVEHLSHWWRMVGVPHNDAGYNYTIRQLASYVSRQLDATGTSTTMNDESNPARSRGLNSTVAIVSFARVRSGRNGAFGVPPLNDTELAQRNHVTTVASLGATLASLIRAGVGRVVVVGSNPIDDPPVVYQTFQKLLDKPVTKEEDGARDWFALSPSSEAEDHPAVISVANTDLTFAAVPMDMVNTTMEKNNVPRGAQAGLQRAFRNVDDADWTYKWLGDDPSIWKYVYYSEGDTLLQTRPSVIQHVVQQLDEGQILAPHRLQLLAYEGDVLDYHLHSPQGRLVPADFKTPVTVNSGEVVVVTTTNRGAEEDADDVPTYQHCCDALEGNYRPGRDEYPHCGNFWYRCGFMNSDGKAGNHTRLEPYHLIRLSDGTGITTLSATEHGRRCHPSHVPCRRRPPQEDEAAAAASQAAVAQS